MARQDYLFSEHSTGYVQVRSMKSGDDFWKLWEDTQGSFRKYNKNFTESYPLATEALGHLSSGDAVSLSADEVKALGAGAYNLWLKIDVPDSKGNQLELDSAEFIAWQREAPDKAPDVWAKERGVDIISQKRTVEAGDQTVNIEWNQGGRRCVTYKGIVTEERKGHYGEIVIDGPDGKPVYNGDGLPDIFISDDNMRQMENGNAYRGRVLVMDQQKGSKGFDEVKFAFNDDGKGKSDERLTQDFLAMQASSFTNLHDFYNSKAGPVHVMSYGQYKAWEYDVAAHPDHSKIAFGDWVTQQWGSKERFDGIFGGMGELSQEQYRTISTISAGADRALGTSDDLSAEQVMQHYAQEKERSGIGR